MTRHAQEAIYVVGAGGIGCALGYALCSSGARVVFVDANAAKVAWGRANGVRVDRLPPRQAEFQSFDEWTPAAGATVLLCTKCYDNPIVLERLRSCAGEDVTLLPVQNGFDPALQAFGHAWEGIASFISECIPNRTHTRITRRGRIHLGRRDGADGHNAREPNVVCGVVAGLAVLPRIRTTIVPDILPYKYTKLLYNAAISPVASAGGIDNGQLLLIPQARRLFFSLIQENYEILTGGGIALAKIGTFHPHTVQRILSRPIVARAFAWALYPSLRRTYCSMAADLPAGRTEIDFYNGHLIALAADRPCPVNSRVYELFKRMEQERLPPGMERLAELGDLAPACDGFASSEAKRHTE